MGLFFNAGGSVSGEQTDNDTKETTLAEQIKNSTANSSGDVTNSGSTNQTKTNTVNSGSTNNSSTVNSGSTNTVTNSGSTNTTHTNESVNTSQLMLTDQASMHLVNQLLEGAQGLAAVTKGQMSAGGYNSTANTLLSNDLISRVAGDVAARSAITKTTIGATDSTQNIGGSTQTTNIGGSTSNTTQNIGGSTSSSDVLNIIGGSSTHTNTITEAVDHILGATNATKEQDVRNTKEEAHGGGGWIVCTELVRQHRMPKRFYLYGSQVFAKYHPRDKKGYYYWAVPAVNHLRQHPHSKLSKLLELVMNPRAEYLAAEAGCKGARKTVAGFIVKHGLYIICCTLARTVARNYSVDSAQFRPLTTKEIGNGI